MNQIAMYIPGCEQKLGLKTRFFNIFRHFLKSKPLEEFLAEKIQNQATGNFWMRLVPSHYLYKKNSWRETERHGVKYHLDISDYTEHSIYFGYLENEHSELFEMAKGKRVIIDVGVNVGSTLLNFAKICPDGFVFGFEPDVNSISKAERNLKLNEFHNAAIIKKGLGDQNVRARLYKVNGGNAGQNRFLNSADSKLIGESNYNEAEIIKLDDFVEEKGLDRIDLIKIDVEGFELNVLKGAEQSLRKFSPVLFIELMDANLTLQGENSKSLICFLERLGYEIYHARTKEIIRSKDETDHYTCDIICKKR